MTERVKKDVHVEIEYHPTTRRYRLIGATPEVKIPRRRYYDSHGEVLEAIEAANPGYDAYA